MTGELSLSACEGRDTSQKNRSSGSSNSKRAEPRIFTFWRQAGFQSSLWPTPGQRYLAALRRHAAESKD